LPLIIPTRPDVVSNPVPTILPGLRNNESKPTEFQSLVVAAGFGLVILGSVLLFLPRRGMFYWAIQSREELKERYLNRGDEKMALGISREIEALQPRSSRYSMVCFVLGILLMSSAFLF